MFRRSVLSIFACLLLTSCAGQPVAVSPADIDAIDAADKLLVAYDSNADNAISIAEAENCAGVHPQFAKYDTNSNGQLSRDEIFARFQSWSTDGVGVMKVGCLVTLDGQRLPDAVIRFAPEPLLGDALKPATGTTDAHGQCSLSVDPAELPSALQRVRGVMPGLYRVHITHPTALPARYNIETTLGQEVASDTIGPEGIQFELTTQ